jgi:phosphohistidine phosphatase
MKMLYIMRHGKAEDGLNKADYKRKLSSKGIKRNQKICTQLKERKIVFDTILCSNANRTIETAQIIADCLNYPQGDIQEAKELYLATVRTLLDQLYALDNKINSVLMIGHNPGISELIGSLSGKLIDWLPTSALIALEIDTDLWENIGNAPVKIAFSLTSKT